MNILYIDLCLDYVNPTRKNVVTLLNNIGNLTLFGPGYQSEDTLKEGLNEFYKKKDYDLVVINELLIFYLYRGYRATSNKPYKNYHNNYYFQFDINILKDFFNDCIDFLESAFDAPKVVCLLESDYYNFAPSQIESLEKFNGYIMGWGKEFVDYNINLADLDKESFASKSNDNYLNFIQNCEKIISTPHFVTQGEFNYGVLESRKHEVSVVGASYYMREKIRNIIRRNKIKMYRSRSKPIFRLLSKLKLKPYANYLSLKFYNNSFFKVLIESKAVFTDGSRLRWPIRKYFEIPAAGAVLLTDGLNGFSELGFVDEENCFLADENTIMSQLNYLETRPDIAQTVAKKGQELISSRHSLQARTVQVELCFNKILNGSFKGSYWKNGEFCVK